MGAFLRLWVSVLSLCSAAAQMFGSWPVINTSTGSIRGHMNGTRFSPTCAAFPPTRILPVAAAPNIAAFLGVPYAEAPVGERRFKPPEEKKPWSEILEAKHPGPVCAQLPVSGVVHVDPTKWSKPDEDCLRLNIWAPTNSDGSLNGGRRPIVIYLHGGGYVGGSGFTELNCAFYDGEGLAHDMDAVVVTINYRLGVFGFLADPTLLEESGTTGNYGLQDQRAAMRWVRENAKALGGDPDKITIMGESAGGASVYHHLAMPRSQDLFSQAVALSGYEVTWDLAEAYKRSGTITSKLGCDAQASRIQCLRNASTMQLVRAEDDLVFGAGYDLYKRMMTFGPVSDGFELPDKVNLLQALKVARSKKSVLLGSNLNESNLFFCIDKLPSNLNRTSAKQNVFDKAKFIFPDGAMTNTDVDAVMDDYMGHLKPEDAIKEFSSDVLFTCTAEKVSSILTESGAHVYRYLFARSPHTFRLDSCLGVPHMAELLYIFSDAFPSQIRGGVIGGPTDMALAKDLIAALGRFVREGSPGHGWSAWEDSSKPTMRIGDANDAKFTQLHGYKSGICKKIEGRILDARTRSPRNTIVI
eukprot:TRINITY_DN26032_c0_g1_i1.p1 TRINITY_DN26032_c0_g1~~TRINITY_DN26032_c0_g1_i1.p1  ORF type:complete len:583 (-),score=90.36 TRINITY_DN26032_c0_g1_i1:22-1770(-)